jgi:hypothetical protein
MRRLIRIPMDFFSAFPPSASTVSGCTSSYATLRQGGAAFPEFGAVRIHARCLRTNSRGWPNSGRLVWRHCS